MGPTHVHDSQPILPLALLFVSFRPTARSNLSFFILFYFSFLLFLAKHSENQTTIKTRFDGLPLPTIAHFDSSLFFFFPFPYLSRPNLLVYALLVFLSGI